MTQTHGAPTDRSLIDGPLDRIAGALETIAAGGRTGETERFNPRELVLLLEAVEYLITDAATGPDEREYRGLLARLLVMTGQEKRVG